MKIGMVMSIEKKWAYVFTENCQIMKVASRPQMALGQEVELPAVGKLEIWTRRRAALAAVAALLVLILALGILVGTGNFLSPVYATLSIDINPGIEMDLNRALTVIQVRAMNEQSAFLLNGCNYTGMHWEEAVKQWTLVVATQQSNPLHLVLVSAVLPEGAASLQARLLQLTEQIQLEVHQQVQVRVVYSHDVNVRKMARLNGLTIGRQMLLNQSLAREQSWNAESISNAPLGELVRDLLHEADYDQTGLTIAKRAQSRAGETRQIKQETEETARQEQRTDDSSASQPITDREQQTQQETAKVTERETSRETQTQPAVTPAGEQATQRETQRETKIQGQTEEQNQPDETQLPSPAASPGRHAD